MNVKIPIEISAEDADTSEEQRLLIRPHYEQPRIDRPISPSMLSSDLVAVSSGSDGAINGIELEFMTSADPSHKEESSVFVREDRLVDEGTKTRLPNGTFVTPLPVDLKDRFSEVQRRKRVPEIVSLLKEVEPAIEDLRLLDPPGLLYADAGAAELIPVNLMGGGIMKLLSTALAMLSMQDGFVLTDEVENGLDSSSQRRLWDAIFSWAQRLNVQVFASTHSMECIRAFSDGAEAGLFGTEAKLFRIERAGDKFRAIEYTRELLAESLDSSWEVR
jgi:hypothetical protein